MNGVHPSERIVGHREGVCLTVLAFLRSGREYNAVKLKYDDSYINFCIIVITHDRVCY
jgi:hypothetical protein